MAQDLSTSKTRSAYLKKKIVIGSAAGIVNFPARQAVFHHDEIAPEKRLRKQEVKAWVKQDKLIQEHLGWNNSTDTHNPVCERRTMENFVNDRCAFINYSCYYYFYSILFLNLSIILTLFICSENLCL